MKKEYTPFGKFFSKLRKDRKQSITEAAKLLGVSIAYISSVEHGDREIPYSWKGKIVEEYNLNEKEINELEKSYYDTPSLKKIPLADVEWCMTNFINNIYNGEDKEKALIKLKKMLDEFRK